MDKVLMLIGPDEFKEEEYYYPKKAFEEHGAEVTTASLRAGRCFGHLKGEYRSDVAIASVDPEEYDAIVYVGGPGADVFFENADAHRVAQKAVELGKVVAASGIAPAILARAGLLEGRRVTSWPTVKDELREFGAQYTGQWVTTDEQFVTATGPVAVYEWAAAIEKAHEVLVERAERAAAEAAAAEAKAAAAAEAAEGAESDEAPADETAADTEAAAGEPETDA
jgi:protease I